jgi:hypothetical protein
MKLILRSNLNSILKKTLKVILLLTLLVSLTEFILRVIGFGEPVLYQNNGNYILKPDQKVKRFKGSKVIINKFGMRTNYKWSDNKNVNKILFFGDSVTFGGSYVDNLNLFSEKFCKIKKNSICGNYGTNGYKLENINLRIDKVTSRLDFDHLIIVSSSSLTAGKSIFFDFPFYENFNYKIFKAITEIFNHFLFKYKIINNYHEKKNYKIQKINNESSINNTKIILKKLNQKGIRIDLFILPTLENLNEKKKSKHFLENIMLDNINIINLYEEIYKQDYESLYFNNAHLNEKGHDYLSKLLYKLLK